MIEVDRELVQRITVVKPDVRRDLRHAPREEFGRISVVKVVREVIHLCGHHVEGGSAPRKREQSPDQPAREPVHLQARRI